MQPPHGAHRPRKGMVDLRNGSGQAERSQLLRAEQAGEGATFIQKGRGFNEGETLKGLRNNAEFAHAHQA